MKNFEENLLAWLFAAMLAVGLLYPVFADAQRVQQQGKVFIQQPSKRATEPKVNIPSGYTYQTSDGKQYPIYISENGKAYIIRKSKKGNTYKQYLPEITKKLQTKKED